MAKKKTADKSKSANSKEQEAVEKQSDVNDLQKSTIHEWEANTRPYKKLDKDVFSTILAGAFLLGVILYFIDGAVPVMALASLVFLFYVMGTVPPGKTYHKITNWGLESEDKLYVWDALLRYWVQGKEGNKMLVVETNLKWPRHIRFMIEDKDEEKIHEIMQRYLVEDQPAPNWIDKSTAWLERKIRLSPDG
jgi:hypothetical protein